MSGDFGVTEDGEIVDVNPSSGGALEAQTRGEIDIQIRTARAYPRSIKQFLNLALEMATLDVETAERCFYALPRGGKTIEGPSARLGEIVASAWGHMRVESRIIENDGRFLTAKGVAWDLQNNVAVSTEVRRRITDRSGRTFNDDMIMTTANAACSIARRNAVFAVVPNSYTRQIYERCRLVAVGDASTLSANRTKVLSGLAKMGATAERVFALLGVRGEEDITLEHLALLKGLGTAIREGDTTVDEAFPDPRAAAAAETAKGSDALKEKLRANGNGAPAPAGPSVEEMASAEHMRRAEERSQQTAAERATEPVTVTPARSGEDLKREFVERARLSGFAGKLSELVVEVLGSQPAQWGAETWSTALGKSPADLSAAIARLQGSAAENAPVETVVPAPVAAPAGDEDDFQWEDEGRTTLLDAPPAPAGVTLPGAFA